MAHRHWSFFGYARAEDYAREVLGRSGRWLRDRACLGDALDRMPALATAITGEDGGRSVGQAAAMAVARVATPDTVQAWIDRARQVTVRRLKDEVRAARDRGLDSEPVVPIQSPESTEPGEDDSPCRVSIWAPAVTEILYEDAFNLHHAVCGHETTPASFVEALVGEAMSSPMAALDDAQLSRPPVGARESHWRQMEEDLYRNTGAWSHLPAEPHGSELSPLSLLAESRDAIARAGQGGPRDLQAQMLRLVALEERLQQELGDLLMLQGHERAFRALEFAGVGHYAEQRLGLSRSSAFDRITLARASMVRPVLAEAYSEGRIGLESALLLVRLFRREGPVMTRKEEDEWIRHAGEVTVKRLRDEVRLVRDRVLAAGALGPVSIRLPQDSEWYASIRRAPGDARTRLRTLGPQADGGRMGFISLTLPRSLAADFLRIIKARRQLLALAATDSVRTDSTGGAASSVRTDSIGAAEHAGLAANISPHSVALGWARRLASQGHALPLWVGLLALIEDYVEIWDDPRGTPRRATSRIYIRDGWRCAAPGCTSRRHLESHHVIYRSRGGEMKSENNQVCLCRFHHQQGEHGGLAEVRGRAPLGLVWRLGDRSVGTWYASERRLQ